MMRMKKSLLSIAGVSLLAACGQHRCHQVDFSQRPVNAGITQNNLQSTATEAQLHLDPNALDFHYRVKGDCVSWSPIHVFDDGKKTYIEMPAKVDVLDLPVLYAERNHKRQLINHRYLKPYFIVDGLIESAVLVTDKGSSERLVRIRHCQSFSA